MIDINKVIDKAKENAEKLEKLPVCTDVNTVILNDLRQYKYPAERDLEKYIERLPDLPDILKSKEKILDIGTGQGLALSQIRNQYNCYVTGTGIAPIENMLGIQFQIAEASQLPFDDNSFDLVLSVHGISWAPHQKKAIEEAIRVVKPGKYCLMELIKFSHAVSSWYGDEFWEELNIDKEEFISEYDYSPEMTFGSADVELTLVPVPERWYKVKYYLKCRKKK